MSGPARHVVVLTGAGISADSGLSVFRGGGGLWEGHRIEEVATPEAWLADPELVWRFYQMRRAALREVEPNAAHHALVRLEHELEARGDGYTLVTQNVDGLHQRAGSTALAMHGDLEWLCCEACGHRLHDATSFDPVRFLPCRACEHPRLRPDIVWFGEMPKHLEAIERALAACTHFLAIGTSGIVYPAAWFLQSARERGALTWVQSLEAPDNLHPADDFRAGHSRDVVPRLVEELLAP